MRRDDFLFKCLSYVTFIATLFALLVISLGAYTRLTDAGLGCPDWPGCYGHLAVPSTQDSLKQAQVDYPTTPVVAKKAWAEMIHRYLAGTLSLLIAVIAFIAVWVARNKGFSYLVWVSALFLLIIYQATLGMLTVTLKLLPLVVTQHLLGGMCIAVLLWVLHLKTRPPMSISAFYFPRLNALKVWSLFGLLILFFQISLGAWTSTNYASLSCPDFPFCHLDSAMQYDFHAAFNLFSPLGVNYEGGVLSDAARMTIHMTHRAGAVFVFFYLLTLAIRLFSVLPKYHAMRKIVWTMLMFLSFQLTLGFLNVFLSLPLPIAVAHNIMAVFLLLSVVTLNYRLFTLRTL